MTDRTMAGVCLWLALVVMTGGMAAGQAPPPAPVPPAAVPIAATVDQLAWIAGAWQGTLNDRTIEQTWSAPLGGSMLAMYRSVRDNKVTLYELLAFEPENNGVVLRIKHFAPGPGLVSQEAKDESVNHALVKLDGRTAVFQGAARVTFSSPDPSSLTITVERQREGKTVATEFKYRRAAP